MPSEKERELITEVIASWFMVGRLGGYNAMNMQVVTYPHHLALSNHSLMRINSTMMPYVEPHHS